MKLKLRALVLVVSVILFAGMVKAGVENQRRNGFSEAQIAEISAKYPGCLDNTTSSNSESEDQANQFRDLLPAQAGRAAAAPRATPQGSDQ